MASATRRVVVGLIAVGLLVTARTARADEKAATPRIRSNPGIAALIAQATQQSKTFRGLVDHIENSDAIVYIEQGDCGHSVKACLAIAATPQPVSADDAPRLHLRVQVVADARVPRDVVERAKPETARIYQHIGIDVVFVDEPSAGTITVRVVERPMKGATGDAMGIAPRSGSRIGRLVYAFYGRVDACARQHAIPVEQVLGHVMAHELGHLLLPHESHVKRGIMTAGWDRKQIEQIGRGWLSFTKEQAEAIRARVSGLIPSP